MSEFGRRIGYSEKVIEHFMNPRNIGKLEDADATAIVGSVACGDLIKFYIKVDPETDRITDIRFESYGCASNIATSSMTTVMAKGKTLEEAKKITFKQVAEALGGLPKTKMHCAVLSITGLHAVIMKYEAKMGRIPINEHFVRRMLRGVLDPLKGVDVITAGEVENVKVDGKEITIRFSLPREDEAASIIEEEVREAFQGLDVRLNLIFS